ncbi:MAG: transcriptional regulator, partial [Brevundimonas sp.]
AYLAGAEAADFATLKQQLELPDGNLAVHLKMREEAGVVAVAKRFVDRKPVTRARMTEVGRDAFVGYLDAMAALVKG